MRETANFSVVASLSRLYILFNKFASVGKSTIPSWPSRTIQSGWGNRPC